MSVPQSKWGVAIGSPLDGITLYGPFDTADEANDWASYEDFDDYWWIAELVNPDTTLAAWELKAKEKGLEYTTSRKDGVTAYIFYKPPKEVNAEPKVRMIVKYNGPGNAWSVFREEADEKDVPMFTPNLDMYAAFDLVIDFMSGLDAWDLL